MVNNNRIIGGLIIFLVGALLFYFKIGDYYYIWSSSLYFLIGYYLQFILLIPTILIGGILLLRNQIAGAKIGIIGGLILLIFGIVDMIMYNLAYDYGAYMSSAEYIAFIFHMFLDLALLQIVIIIGGAIGLRKDSEKWIIIKK